MGDNPEIAKQEEDKKKNRKRDRVFGESNPDSRRRFRNCFLIVGRRSKEEIEEGKDIKGLTDLWVKIDEAQHKKIMIEEIAGFKHHHFDNLNAIDYLEKEFDPIGYDNNMNILFGDDYYNADDHIHSKPEYDDDDLAGLPVNNNELDSDVNSTNSTNSEIVEALRRDLEDKYEALTSNFKYRKVKPDRSKLSAALILWLDEQELKQYVDEQRKKKQKKKKPKNRT